MARAAPEAHAALAHRSAWRTARSRDASAAELGVGDHPTEAGDCKVGRAALPAAGCCDSCGWRSAGELMSWAASSRSDLAMLSAKSGRGWAPVPTAGCHGAPGPE